MKILVCSNLIPNKLGAYEQLLGCVARRCQDAGDTLTVALAGEPIPAFAKELQAAGARWCCVAGWTASDGREHPWRFVGQILGIIQSERPDVVAVHFGNELPTLVACWLSRLIGSRARWVWEQDQQIRPAGGVTRWISKIRLLTLGIKHFVAVYDGGGRSLVQRGVPAARLTVIRNAVADHVTRCDRGWLRQELAVADSTPLLVCAASLIARKRVDFILQAFAQLDEDKTMPVLVLVGDGSERTSLETAAGALGIADRVHFLGLRQDLRDVLTECDIQVHAAEAEGAVYVVVEGMAAGLPVVITEAGAVHEQVEHGETGFIVQRDDLEAFVAYVRVLLTDAATRRQMGAAARQRWAAHYQLDNAAAAYHDLYQQLADR